MSEDRTNRTTQEELMRRLKAIGADLWGGMTTPGAPEDPTPAATETAAPPAKKENEGSGKEAQEDREKEPGLDRLWIVADETVDWTDALLWDTPRDGLTGQKKWTFLHRMARRVLAGEKEAYAEVLTTLNPLGDLTRYVSGMILKTPGADRLECVFECQQELLEEKGRAYLCALSLRIARDLLAVLPVSEVGVTGNLEGTEKIRITFRRDQLLKRKMAFVNPEELALECGGSISAEPDRQRKA